MTNNTTIFLAAILCTVSTTACAFQKPDSAPQVESSTSGLATYGREKLDNVRANGRVTLEGTQVTGLLDVNGSVTAQDATLNSLAVGGHAYIYNTKVSGKADINGFFSAEKSRFENDLVVKAHKITLKNCTTESIYIKNVMWPFNTHVVELLDGTHCNGNITFESGKGSVILRDGSTLHGKVIGGNAEQEIQVQKG